MAYEDRNLTCVECNSEFVFSADDQQFHSERGYQDPKRCPSCRQARRGGGGGGGGGGGYGGGGDYGGSRQMYDAVCASCGNACQVPFLPRQDRPVYCSDCFSKQKESSPRW
ncbi:MAG: zinc-ribbon domain containing protein [Chloroflexi bacterium]|nr:zinc-ribbon domain containing protein [Chloroflexota bacterium]